MWRSRSVHSIYINTKVNVLADNLSRDNQPAFLSDVPLVQRWATPLPAALIDLLLDPSLDWTSKSSIATCDKVRGNQGIKDINCAVQSLQVLFHVLIFQLMCL